MTRISGLLLMFSLCTIFIGTSYGKPTEVIVNPESLNPVQSEVNGSVETDKNREQRSPQFGLLGGFDDYSDYDYSDDSRHYKLGQKHKFHKGHHKPLSGHGCDGFDCGHGYPGHEGYYNGHHPDGEGGSFATASAGSLSGGGRPYGGHSQANAQSASFSFGPYTATFSVAQSSSGHKRR